uniref:Secreted protein n=1 Tax=Macrostomum lignano TaxID=282301 RepID=A0A1I8HSD5_9PLAT
MSVALATKLTSILRLRPRRSQLSMRTLPLPQLPPTMTPLLQQPTMALAVTADSALKSPLVYTAATATVRLCCSTAHRRNRRVLLAKNRIDNACRLSSATQSVALTTCCWRSPLAATRSQPRPAGFAHRCTAC